MMNLLLTDSEKGVLYSFENIKGFTLFRDTIEVIEKDGKTKIHRLYDGEYVTCVSCVESKGI